MKRNSVLLTIAAFALVWSGLNAAGQQSQEQASRPGQPARAAQPQSDPSAVTKAQFERWMTELSNWGRWGKDDERGALNLITAEKRKQASALAKTGTAVSLSRPMMRGNAATTQSRAVNQSGRLMNRFLAEPSPLKDGN